MAHQARNVRWEALTSRLKTVAHQTHNIHWDALTSCLNIHSPEAPTKVKPTNLYFLFEPNQDEKISRFVASFINNIKEHTACERKKYPEKFDVPDGNDLILGDAITQKITPLVYKWRQTHEWKEAIPYQRKSSLRRLCTHNDGFECGCAIPLQERKASSFLRCHTLNNCFEFYDKNKEAFYNLEVVKTLILYEEMEPILRVCAHPDVDYAEWETQGECCCMGNDCGWETVYESALRAYLALNILYCFPELWDPASSSSSSSSRSTDYRSTELYQLMLRYCTSSDSTSEVGKYPHIAFYGIGDDRFRSWPHFKPVLRLKYMPDIDKKDMVRERHIPYGAVPFEDSLNSKVHTTEHLPDVSAVALVGDMLHSKGLPVELVDDVMEKADYTAKRRLVYAHDPLHPGNLEELQQYLKYCWRLMVNCNLMADALGTGIEWESVIYRFLAGHISSLGEKRIARPDIKY